MKPSKQFEQFQRQVMALDKQYDRINQTLWEIHQSIEALLPEEAEPVRPDWIPAYQVPAETRRQKIDRQRREADVYIADRAEREAARDALFAERERIARIFDTTTCSSCGAQPYEMCRTKSGKVAYRMHAARYNAAGYAETREAS